MSLSLVLCIISEVRNRTSTISLTSNLLREGEIGEVGDMLETGMVVEEQETKVVL